ncbi:MAG: efflux RND transporter permease subunit, partial [Pseudomonadota bacterium]
MAFSRFFIDRPIFATVISLIITIVGAIAQFGLPVAEYPEIAPPTVNITASYPGASAEIIAETVATPIEQEVNGVDGMLYIVSQSTGDGRLSVNVVPSTRTVTATWSGSPQMLRKSGTALPSRYCTLRLSCASTGSC